MLPWVPHKLRVDRGMEFWGELVRYRKCLGIEWGPIATLNSCTNRMVEHLVETFKARVKRCMEACPNGHWWDAMPDIARGIYQLLSRFTG